MADVTDDFKIWEGIYSDFPQFQKTASAFAEHPSIERARSIVASWLARLQRGEPVANVSIFHQYPLPIVVALMADKGCIQVLDFGGGLGQTYLMVQATLRTRGSLEFYILEQDELVEVGRDLFQGDVQVHFIESFDDAPRVVDVVHTGSAFQYVDDWHGLLRQFAAMEPKYIVFGNLLAGEIKPCVTFQNYWGHKIPVRLHNYETVIAVLAELNYRVVFDAFHEQTILGKCQPLPLDHFPEEHRLVYGRNVILKRIVGVS